MNAQYKKGIIEVCLLALIKKGYSSAYQITKAMKDYLDITENTIYPMLRRLKDKDHLTYEKIKTIAGAPIKEYQLTDRGLKHLVEEKIRWHQFTQQISKILGDDDESKSIS